MDTKPILRNYILVTLTAVFIFLVIFFLVMPKVNDNDLKTFTNNDLKTFTNAVGGFQIQYPRSWYLKEFPPEEIGTKYEKFNSETNEYDSKFIDEKTNYTVTFGPVRGDLASPLHGGGGYIRIEVFQGTLEEYFELALERNILLNIKKNREGMPLDEIKEYFFGNEFTLNGVKGYIKTEQNGLPGLPGSGTSSYETITVVLGDKTKTYVISMMNTKNDPNVKTVFETMLPTFSTLQIRNQNNDRL